ncbi:MAG: response regulator [Verrucomicrobia bacterium]|nr:response regulator [Verrucomicrobiota bacterium]
MIENARNFREAPQAGQRGGRHAHILVLDDEVTLGQLLGLILQAIGHQATICSSPNEALQLLAAGQFDLVLSDLNMPEMNGREFYEQATQQQPGLAGRILFLTGDSFSEEARRFIESTGNPYLDKPFRLDEVKEAINVALAHLAPPVEGASLAA